MNRFGDYLKLFAGTLVAFLVIDLAWLGLVAAGLYRQYLGGLMAENPIWAAAFVFYFVFITGLIVFVVQPGLENGALQPTLLRGAFFGFVAYATFDLTCLATLKDWPLVITLVDLAWGTVLCLLTTWVSFAIGQRLGLGVRK